jgi:hypothetical protein
MTSKQMVRAMKKWGISLIYYKDMGRWFAGDGTETDGGNRLSVQCRGPHGYLHSHDTMEGAVEDYCNARNLEWDV